MFACKTPANIVCANETTVITENHNKPHNLIQ